MFSDDVSTSLIRAQRAVQYVSISLYAELTPLVINQWILFILVSLKDDVSGVHKINDYTL
jgi:hypothetical protein